MELLIGACVVAFVLLVLGIFIKANTFICPPNTVLVFSGRQRKVSAPDPSGEPGKTITKSIGYRVIKGGRGFRVPLIETVQRISLTNMSVELRVQDAYAKGNIPLNIGAVANVKVCGDEPLLGNAIERFLGREPESIASVARETLEGNLRGVLGTLTPEEANGDRMAFGKKLDEEVSDDFSALGLKLDTLNIQSVSDNVQYLDAVGRVRIAEVKRDADIAEAVASQESTVAANEADKIKAESSQALEIRRAELLGAQKEKEEGARRQAQEAQIAVDKDLEEQRNVVVRKRLQNEEFEPAEARRRVAEEDAKAKAATIREDGAAQAEIVKVQGEADAARIKATGDAETQVLQERAGLLAQNDGARDLIVLQILPQIVDRVCEMGEKIDVDKLVIIDGPGGDGTSSGVAATMRQMAAGLPAVVELADAAGIDLSGMLAGLRRDGPEERAVGAE